MCCMYVVEGSAFNSILSYCELKYINVRKKSVWLIFEITVDKRQCICTSAANLELNLQFIAAFEVIHKNRYKDLLKQILLSHVDS